MDLFVAVVVRHDLLSCALVRHWRIYSVVAFRFLTRSPDTHISKRGNCGEERFLTSRGGCS